MKEGDSKRFKFSERLRKDSERFGIIKTNLEKTQTNSDI